MKEELYDKIYEDFEKYCNDLNKKNRLVCDFDFSDDNQGDFAVWDVSYMEDEDTFKEDAINIFKENGVVPISAEWDYDAGDDYSRICVLEIVF